MIPLRAAAAAVRAQIRSEERLGGGSARAETSGGSDHSAELVRAVRTRTEGTVSGRPRTAQKKKQKKKTKPQKSAAANPPGGMQSSGADEVEDEAEYDQLQQQSCKAGKAPVARRAVVRSRVPKDTSWKSRVAINVVHTHYEVIRDVIRDLGFTVAKGDVTDAFVIWYNSAPPTEAIGALKPYQKINHFPASSEISRKDSLARNLNRLQKAFPAEYSFYPKSWVLPAEYIPFKKYYEHWKSKGRPKTFIYKPTNSAQGKGIALARNADSISATDTLLVQEYLAKPFLIDSFKFDLRIYVLVTSIDPLRVFIYDDGLVRLSTKAYKAPTDANLGQLYMHLTNYSVNKNSEEFDDTDSADAGSKRTLKWMMGWLAEQGHDTGKLWGRVGDVILKTLMVALPANIHEYRVARRTSAEAAASQPADTPSNCFAIYGFDIFLDRKLNPMIIEVNRSPSFSCDADLDREIKYGVIRSTFKLLKLRPSEKTKAEARQRQAAQGRLFGSASKGGRANRSKHGDYGSSDGTITRTRGGERVLTKAAMAAQAAKEADEAAQKAVAAAASKEEQKQKDAEFEKARLVYESKNRGGFQRIFPPEDPEKAALYAKIMAESERLYYAASGTGVKQKTVAEASIASARGDGLCSTTALRSEPIPPIPKRKKPPESGAKLGPPGGYRSTMSMAALDRDRARSDAGPGKAVFDVDLQTKGLLQALREMRISCPGHTDDETVALVKPVRDAWPEHADSVAKYWLNALDRRRRVEIVKIVQSNVMCVVGSFWSASVASRVRVVQVINRIFERLTWHNGHNLYRTFHVQLKQCLDGLINLSHTSALEQQCCYRVVELCQDCLLVVYLCSRQVHATQQAEAKKQAQQPPAAPPGGQRPAPPNALPAHVPSPHRQSLTAPGTKPPGTARSSGSGGSAGSGGSGDSSAASSARGSAASSSGLGMAAELSEGHRGAALSVMTFEAPV